MRKGGEGKQGASTTEMCELSKYHLGRLWDILGTLSLAVEMAVT